MAGYATALGDAAEAALAGWVVRSVERRLTAWAGRVDPAVHDAAVVAGRRAVDEVIPRLRLLLATDVAEQRSTPLGVLRGAVPFPTAVLAVAGVPAVVRDEVAQRGFPADVYDLSPANFADIDATVAEPGLLWGAAKAHVILSRRRDRAVGTDT